MCGISALFLKSPDRKQTPFLRSLDLIRHRGPDGQGVLWGQEGTNTVGGTDFDGVFSWALGHVRLAILDISSNGLQPMNRNGGKLWISYNGEVYNYIELKVELELFGYHFHTRTDTEVILAAYSQWGESCLERFVGMFAFVIVDLEKRKVFCARDRFGVKPLYFWQGSLGTFIFSEPKQLKAFPEFTFRANREQVIDFIVDNLANHVANESMFSGVVPLASGHYLSWKLDDSFPNLSLIRSYWKLPDKVEEYSYKEAVDRVRTAVIDSVRIRLRSDVPVGSCLSGGIDSSSLVGVASLGFSQSMHTFSACYPGQKIDEQFYMDAVNRHCGTMPFKVFPTGESFARELDTVVYHQDEPFAGTSIYAQWCVMKAAREKGILVLLDGQGGDEALCGYRKYSFFYLKKLLRQGQIGKFIVHAMMMLLKGDRQLLQLQEGQRYLPRFMRKDDKWIVDSLQPETKKYYRNSWIEGNHGNQSLKDYQRGDLLQWSLPVLLRYEDRNSMAHSVESRVPFVHHRFVELCMSLPDDFFFRDGKTKRLLTQAMGESLPIEVHTRRDKLGFNTPGADWLRGELGVLLQDEILKSESLNQIMDISKLLDCFHSARKDQIGAFPEKLFSIACVAAWMRIFEVRW
jgi:asparagine synthase (glutamine-hydrolysing)